ncbi:hypothetical protein Moror_13056 [Moniliophthora roreri MCA 2997]|uniref:DUF6534 domain-containing protein n=1 Tax=Moniliophthora roreri (strain MCA 2997) TaxID=1381753 RepID=V2XLS4_MONRO|nr:hypothetical protein Moror_13056 [Moniliophthora roreri MCA 2997]
MGEKPLHMAGPLLLGYFLNWGLFGILTVQVYIYWLSFPNDTRVAQALVYCIYGLEISQTILLTHDAFQSFVYGFMDHTSVDRLHLMWLDTYLFDGLIGFLVQVYFATRIHGLLSRTKTLPGIIVLLSISQCAGAISISTIMKDISFISESDDDGYNYAALVPGVIWFGCGITADILIAVTMVYALSRFDTLFHETQNLIQRLNRLAMETGGLIAVTSLVQPLLWFFFPTRFYHLTPALIIGKLYSNSLLAALNSRVRIRGERDGSRNFRVTSTRRATITIPLSTQIRQDRVQSGSWVPSTFPSVLYDTDGLDSSETQMNVSGTKADSRVA